MESFEDLANTIAYHYVANEFMQAEITGAGIRVDQIPGEILCSEFVNRYLDLRKTKSHEMARHELQKELAMYERYVHPMTAIPKHPQVLAELYQELWDVYQIKRLGERLKKDPKGGQLALKEFQLKQIGAVDSLTLQEVSLMLKNEQRLSRENKSVVKITGYEKLCDMIGGFNPGRTGMFLGGTGFGKTNFAINLAVAASKTMRVLYVNMEMGYKDMLKRFSVIASGTSYVDYSKGYYELDWLEGVLRQNGSRITMTSGRALALSQIVGWCRSEVKREPVGLIVIDYDQKVEVSTDHRMDEWKAVQKMMERVEDLAKELETYCLVLAQVNRDGNIASSHRSTYHADTVLQFDVDDVHGTIIQAKKNRHGRKEQALRVQYDDNNSQIRELEVIDTGKRAAVVRRELGPSTKPMRNYARDL